MRQPPVVYIAADSHDCLKYLRGDGHHQVMDSQFCSELLCKGKQTSDERSSSSCVYKTISNLIPSKPGELQKTVCRVTGKHFATFMLKLFLIEDSRMNCLQ